MDQSVLKALAAEHGLDPDTATEDQVNVAVIAKVAESTAKPTTPEAPEAKVDEPEVEPEAEVTAPATVTVSQEVYDEQQRRLEALETEREERELVAATARRDAYADSWVADGRITPAERALARSNLDINEEATVTAYSALPASKVPVKERQAAAATASSSEDALLAASRARMGHSTPKGA